ncbi:MAG TPA: efflux RND transporter periplasmic adaptor subunit [Victivallales bacterium]|nr:efflux RND transporter periplasmic adaptor subunit [Victivallales bacterium]
MEIIFTAAYVLLIWLIYFRFKFLKFTLCAAVIYCAIYAAAIMADIILLGQVTPFSSEASVDSVVLQLQPQWSGYLGKIYIDSNTPIKKGSPILSMDASQWTSRLKKHKAQLPKAVKRYEEALRLTPSGAMAKQDLVFRKSNLDELKEQISLAEYNLRHTVTYAPTNGYIPVLSLRPGMFLGLLNKNSIPFICTDKMWILAKLKQQSVRYVRPGDPVEIALEMYPGIILNGKVVDMVWAQGDVQFFATSKMLKTSEFNPSNQFFVKIKVNETENYPIKYGASGKVVIYTKKSIDLSDVIRQIEIRCESLLNFVYNPF